MKLNAKGMELYNKWQKIWDEATRLSVEEHGEKNAEYGWSSIEDYGFVNNIEDEVGLMVAVYYDTTPWDIMDLAESHHSTKDDEFTFGTTYGEFLAMLKPYFVFKDGEAEEIDKWIA